MVGGNKRQETRKQVSRSRRPLSPSLVGSTGHFLLLEIGTEELPGHDLVDALGQLKVAVPKLLADLRLAYDEVYVSGTPRRLVVLVKGLAPMQADEETVVKGPPADRAFDASGAATPAAAGFARKYGLPVEALEVRQEGAARYVYAVVRREGRPTPEVLAETLAGLVAGIKIGKTMRWNASGVAFSRPIRWFVSLLGETVIPFEYAGLTAGRTTYGPRAEGSPELEIAGADAYLPLVAAHHSHRGSGRAAGRDQGAGDRVGGRGRWGHPARSRPVGRGHRPGGAADRHPREFRRGVPAAAERCVDYGDEEASAVFPDGER